MIDFDRFWIVGVTPYDDEYPEKAEGGVPPGVSAAEIRDWERRHGVTLPEPIRTALGLRNGGWLRNAPVAIAPLDEIAPVDADFWEWTELDDEEAADRRLVFAFGDETEGGATLVMNFNARGPEGVPSVYIDHHGEGTSLVDDSIAGFFEAQLATDAEPSVAWTDAEASLEILAREAIDLTEPGDVEPASRDQILSREGASLVLTTRERTPEGEALERTRLPLPLDAAQAEIRPCRPGPGGTLALHIQPAEHDGIVHEESKTDADGRWKNSTALGVPIYVRFESPDRDRLVALRLRLLGPDGAARAGDGDDRKAELHATLGELTPEQRTSAMLRAAMDLQAETLRGFLDQSGEPGAVPPEVAEAGAMMRRRLEAMAAHVHRKAAADPPDPGTVRRIGDLLKPDAP